MGQYGGQYPMGLAHALAQGEMGADSAFGGEYCPMAGSVQLGVLIPPIPPTLQGHRIPTKSQMPSTWVRPPNPGSTKAMERNSVAVPASDLVTPATGLRRSATP